MRCAEWSGIYVWIYGQYKEKERIKMNVSNERLLGIEEVMEIIPISRSGLYRLMRDGDFPASRQVTPGRVCWRRTDLDEWIVERWEDDGE